MGCQTCAGRAAAAAQYPREVTMPDGSKVNVTSAADERVQREKFRQAERQAAQTKGYTVSR
jgi:hypothetical protein